jgi:hypothetical protein
MLLLGGYALTCHNVIGYSPKKAVDRPPKLNYSSRYDNAEITKAPAPKTRKGREKIKAIEIEEETEESGLCKKYLETGNTLIAFLNTQELSPVYQYFKGSLPFCEHFSYFSSYKFIIHLVIRI